jgi:peptidoglycan hydrolase CwlO-like protein
MICKGLSKKILFGKTIKEIWDDIYSEINPVLKWRKMEKYHQKLKDDVDKGEKELEEKKKIIQDLENKIKERKNGKE